MTICHLYWPSISEIAVLFVLNKKKVVFVFLQELDTRQADRKNCRKGLQVVTFLVFANLVLWLMESFTNQNYLGNEVARSMFGPLTWAIVARVTTPLVIFYRFHSCVFLVEAWRRSRARCG